jgi:hypothetical protein
MAQGATVKRIISVFLLAGVSPHVLILLAFAAAMTYCAQAQNIEGQPIAAQYGEFKVQNEGNGFSFDPANCNVTGGGENFPAFTTGTPVKVVDALPAQTEVSTTVTAFLSGSNCAVSLFGLAYQHTSFYLTSGTGGLQEALNNEKINAGGNNNIILNARWYELIAPRTASTVIGSVSGSYSFGLADITTNPYTNCSRCHRRYGAPRPDCRRLASFRYTWAAVNGFLSKKPSGSCEGPTHSRSADDFKGIGRSRCSCAAQRFSRVCAGAFLVAGPRKSVDDLVPAVSCDRSQDLTSPTRCSRMFMLRA